MKGIVSASLMLVSVLLSGCAGGTPDCGDGETMDLIHDVIAEAVEKRVTWYENSAAARQYMDMFNVEAFRKIPDNYEVSKIRVLNYDKDTDVYECEANIVYDYQPGRERTFRYRVETDQGDSQTLLSYDKAMLGPIF